MPIATFSFETLSREDETLRQMKATFARYGATVEDVDISSIKRTAGVTYREVSLIFADSLNVTFRVKKTGDIYEVRINKKALPIKNQDDQEKAIKEIASALDARRRALQRKFAAARVAPPPTIRMSAKKTEEFLNDKIAKLKDAVAAAREKSEEQKAKTAKLEEQIALLQAEATGA